MKTFHVFGIYQIDYGFPSGKEHFIVDDFGNLLAISMDGMRIAVNAFIMHQEY